MKHLRLLFSSFMLLFSTSLFAQASSNDNSNIILIFFVVIALVLFLMKRKNSAASKEINQKQKGLILIILGIALIIVSKADIFRQFGVYGEALQDAEKFTFISGIAGFIIGGILYATNKQE